MREKEGVRLIIVKRKGKGYELDVIADNTVATRVSAEKLTQAIVDQLSLVGDDYELYVKVPPEKMLNLLNLDSLDSMALLPGEPGEIFVPGPRSKKG